jgi:hypothetical protein
VQSKEGEEMITLTREEAQQVLDALEGSIDAQEWEINDHITKYGEWYRPKRVEYMKQQLANTNSTIETLRARLSAPEPEPLEYWNAVEGWVKLDEVRQHFDSVGCGTIYKKPGEGRQPLYPIPPQREWQGLTDEEMSEAYNVNYSIYKEHVEYVDFVLIYRAIEAKLKERNT